MKYSSCTLFTTFHSLEKIQGISRVEFYEENERFGWIVRLQTLVLSRLNLGEDKRAIAQREFTSHKLESRKTENFIEKLNDFGCFSWIFQVPSFSLRAISESFCCREENIQCRCAQRAVKFHFDYEVSPPLVSLIAQRQQWRSQLEPSS